MQKRTAATIAFLLTGATAYAAVTIIRKRHAQLRDAEDRWHVITVNRPFMDITNVLELPEPLENISSIAAIDMRPTPDMSSTEIAVRLLDDTEHSAGSLRRIRSALRKTQMLLETGEVIEPDSGRSIEPTILNAPLRYMTKFRYGEGRL